MELGSASFRTWFEQRPRPPVLQLRAEIKDRFGQLFRGLAFMHSHGVIHRNLVPPNVLLDATDGTVKLTDMGYSRALNTPLCPYSPEHERLRPQSNREERRLWYRAPELILRQHIYGTAIDIFAAGCLLAEACL